MNKRTSLPNVRSHEIFEFRHGNIQYTAGLGRFEDGRIGEVFLDAGKAGTDVQTHARDGAIILSLLLQYGCPIDDIRHALTRLPDASAAGPFGTLLDIIARHANGDSNARAEQQ